MSMSSKDTLLTLASKPNAARVLLLLGMVALFALAADPAAGIACDETGPVREELCNRP
jgi:hypothetical protein